MTAKEKAEELLDYYWLMDKVTPFLSKEQAKQCALIAVDEILNIVGSIEVPYWQEVKKEIQNL